MTNLPAEKMSGDLATDNDRAQIGAIQFVSFIVADQEFAVPIVSVREIRCWSDATAIPRAPEFMRGVINLRGTIVPIIDMRAQFGQGLTETTAKHVVVVVLVKGRTIGLLVDAVSDILTVNETEIRDVPDINRVQEHGDFIGGLVSIGERMVALIALEAVLQSEFAAIDGALDAAKRR